MLEGRQTAGRGWTRVMDPAVTRQITMTFDFHNTIARCDRWFALEVNGLVPAFLVWNAARSNGPQPSTEQLGAGRTAYVALRAEVSRTGIEIDAVASLEMILPGLDFSIPVAEIRRGVDELMAETFDDDVIPMPGVVETVRFLSGQNVRLGVTSSAVYTPFLLWTLDRFGILGEFSDVLTSADAGFYKSDPGIYNVSAQRLDAAPERIVHVGDSFRFDVEGARAAGMTTVWVQGDRPQPDGSPAELTLPDLIGAGPPLLELATAVVTRERIADV